MCVHCCVYHFSFGTKSISYQFQVTEIGLFVFRLSLSRRFLFAAHEFSANERVCFFSSFLSVFGGRFASSHLDFASGLGCIRHSDGVENHYCYCWAIKQSCASFCVSADFLLFLLLLFVSIFSPDIAKATRHSQSVREK